MQWPVADLRGRARGTCTPPPLAQNFFIFMQFSGKIGQIIGWRPPLGLAPPPLGNPGSATGGRSKEEGGTTDAPPGPKFLHFHAVFWEKLAK